VLKLLILIPVLLMLMLSPINGAVNSAKEYSERMKDSNSSNYITHGGTGWASNDTFAHQQRMEYLIYLLVASIERIEQKMNIREDE
jgi:hypothetical protein